MKKILSLFLSFLLSFSILGCSSIDLGFEDDKTAENLNESTKDELVKNIEEDKSYNSKEEVALYINTYDKLPKNYIKKKQAIELGWESSKGNLWDVTDKMSIGGDYFGNREKKLPVKKDRSYYECDINYQGGYRGSERLVYSDDGLIYYTGDHYNNFELLYGDEQ